eukprot:TRINITY_DN83650_c0_g1_i1.p1 TRINITY_DN83650_c0_g1~~TRINITY_DN83650_c0_g1_i1.p1  ORF type:complete len:570 (+),score=117.45 TRINITY_DN83650_c0_g1_i1:95-1711(+)
MASRGATGPETIKKETLLPDAVRDYTKNHDLENVITTALNNVIQKMPEDPYAFLAEELSKSSNSAPRLESLEPDSTVPRRELRFDVVVATRGVRVRIHSLSLGTALFPTPEAADGEEAEDEPDEVKAQEWEKLIAWIQDFFTNSFGNSVVDEYLAFHERCEGISSAPLPGKADVDVSRVTVSLTNELLTAGASAMDMTPMDFMQRLLSRNGCGDWISPPLREPQDLGLWRKRWPRIALPVLFGGGPSVLKVPTFRCCAALTPFGMLEPPTPPEEEDEQANSAPVDDLPPFGWLYSLVQAIKASQGEAVKALQADKATAAMVVEGIPYGPGSLAQIVQMTQKAIEASLGAVSGNPAEASGVLIMNADEAWLEEEEVYEVETGKHLSLEELVDLYAELTEDGWVKTLVQPFRQEDAETGCELLHDRRPDLHVVQDFGVDQDQEADEIPEEITCSCLWRVPSTLPLILRQYVQQVPQWHEGTLGFGHCAMLDAEAANLPLALDALLAGSMTHVILPAEDVSDAAYQKLSDHADEVLHRIRS